jgi:SAM-dependent methyltransferase
MLEVQEGNLYDYPHYYDLVFGSDWKPELDFLTGCFVEHAERPVERVFEPACGTGRLLYRLADAGYEVSGLDLNERAVEYCNERLERRGHPPSAVVGDMSDFRLPQPVDAAFNMINSFRHLLTDQAAAAHLNCVSKCLAPGGLYILGLHLTPLRGHASESESWSARRGMLCVNTHMWLLSKHPKRREERYGMTYDVHTPTRSFRLADEIVFRTYTAPQFADLLRRTPALEIAAVYDFAYDLDEQVEIREETEDVVYVFRRKA